MNNVFYSPGVVDHRDINFFGWSGVYDIEPIPSSTNRVAVSVHYGELILAQKCSIETLGSY